MELQKFLKGSLGVVVNDLAGENVVAGVFGKTPVSKIFHNPDVKFNDLVKEHFSGFKDPALAESYWINYFLSLEKAFNPTA